jgi:hypothetical protein
MKRYCRRIVWLTPLLLTGVTLPFVSLAAEDRASTVAAIPIHFRLDKPGYVTLVIEDTKGNRVRNLLGETHLPAGEHTISWDGCDEGEAKEGGDLVRRRVAPGTYRLRGLVHDKIHLRYDFSVYSPGSPPWHTKDGSGGWLADHSPAADVVFLPSGGGSSHGGAKARLLVTSTSGETGDEFVWLNEEGRRLFGMNTGFWGGMHLCRDRGAKAPAEYYAYVLASGERDADNTSIELRAFPKEGEIVSIAKISFPRSVKQFKSLAEGYGSNGLAAHDGLAIFSFTQMNKLVFVDVCGKKVIGEVPLSAPRGLEFDKQGRLLVITGKQVKRFRVLAGKTGLETEEVLIGEGLEDPRRIRRSEAGDLLCVADWGKRHQIKVYTAEGKYLRTIGRAGGPQIGLYDEQRMSHPCGMALDDRGRLWVAEAEGYPKRLSLWKTDGTFLRASYGPPKYGGGGALDPRDKTRFYYAEYTGTGGIEFALDWEKGTNAVKSIFWRPDPSAERMPGPAPERAIYRAGHQYMVNCYNGDLRYNQDRGLGIWRMDKDHVARPVAMIGNAADLNNNIWGWPMKHKDAVNALWKGENPAHVLFMWCDKNGDGIAQPEEIQHGVTTRKNARGEILGDMGLMPLVHPDMSITTSYGTWIAPPKIDERGTPIYDLAQQKIVGNPAWQRSPLLAGDWTLSGQDGIPALLGANRKGEAKWRVNFSEGGQPVPGLLVQPARILGLPVKPSKGEAGDLFAIYGEKGAIFLLTMDGLFLQTLGGDQRQFPPWRIDECKRGMLIEGLSFCDEQFHPTINQTADGTIYLVAGHEHSSILRLEGLETVRRLDFGTVEVTEKMLAALPQTHVEKARKTERNTLQVTLRDRAPQADGKLSDWPADTQWARLDDRASAAVLLTEKTLYAAWKLGDANALANGGGDFHYLFKKGGAVDLMIGTNASADKGRQVPVAGDLRLLVTRAKDHTKAVLYRAVAPGSATAEGYLFDSPIGKVHFDQVVDVSDKVSLAQSGGEVEISVPLSVLGFTPKRGQQLLGDIGVLRGDGAQTTQRIYWNNLDTNLVSDIPGEARLRPANWGIWNVR